MPVVCWSGQDGPSSHTSTGPIQPYLPGVAHSIRIPPVPLLKRTIDLYAPDEAQVLNDHMPLYSCTVKGTMIDTEHAPYTYRAQGSWGLLYRLTAETSVYIACITQ